MVSKIIAVLLFIAFAERASKASELDDKLIQAEKEYEIALKNQEAQISAFKLHIEIQEYQYRELRNSFDSVRSIAAKTVNLKDRSPSERAALLDSILNGVRSRQ